MRSTTGLGLEAGVGLGVGGVESGADPEMARPQPGPGVGWLAARPDPHTGLSGVAAALIGLGIERRCAGCGAEDRLLCPGCQGELEGVPFAAWPTPCPAGLPPPTAVAGYDGPVRAVLLAHKEQGRLALARPLGATLARAVAAALETSARREVLSAERGPPIMVPVPSARSAVRARGHDAMLRIARVAAGRLRIAGRQVQVVPVLRPTRVRLDQAGLTSEERRVNLAGALMVPAAYRPVLAGREVVVVDDVITTGSTLAEAARAVTGSGAASVVVATIAATARRGGDLLKIQPEAAQPHHALHVAGENR